MPAPSRLKSYRKPDSMFQLRATGADLREISRELRAQNQKEITRQFRKELRAVAAPFVPAVRKAIDGIPVKGTSGSTGLRERLKKDVKLTVRTVGKNARVSIGIPGNRMPPHEGSLPAMMEGTKKWRHPVFGDHDSGTWVGQESHPFFYRTVRMMGPAAKAAINRVTDRITRKIT